MKRLVLFIVALVFAFCTTVMAAGDMTAPAAAPETTPLTGKAAPAKEVKKVKKMKKAKKMKKEEKKEMAPAEAPAK